MTRDTDCDIAVVGGGISGMAAALGLHHAGFSVQLVERSQPRPWQASAVYDPRVYAISPASAQFLTQLDLWPAVLAARAAPIRGMRIWDRDPDAGLHFQASALAPEVLGWIVEHSLLAQMLRDALPATCLRGGAEVHAAHFEGDDAPTQGAPVELELDDGSQLRARLAIGAEGAQSRLREAAGIDTLGWAYEATAVVCHLHSALPHRDEALQRFLPSGPVALLPLPDGRRSLVWSTTNADANALLRLDDIDFCTHLDTAVQHRAGDLGQPTARLRFPLRLMHARRYVAPHCALIGDSAHLIHPMAGQGQNLGLGDAQALVQVLSEARAAGRDWSGQRCLRRFERARQAENLDMLAITDALNRGYGLDLPGWQRVLSLGLQAVERLGPLKQALVARATGAAR